ncbi:MAG: putative pre6S rRNA nuclease [Thermosediminibacterales bacterium]|nr:putative pre6S rRNA nuclease [Thermosediminibacterales bacterium]
MRIMGLDVGDKTIGVAISDETGLIAQGVQVIHRKNIEEDLKQLKELESRYNVEEFVVGLPKNMNGSIGPQGEKVFKFVNKMKSCFSKPIVLWDERLTTLAAERTLLEADMSRKKRKKILDKIAAVLILQNYLNHPNSKKKEV